MPKKLRGKRILGENKNEIEYIEPVQQNLLNVVLSKMNASKKTHYLQRLIYIGEHNYDITNKVIKQHFYQSINAVNTVPCGAQLSGVLLYYPRYFCHIVEGSEKNMMKHIRFLNKPMLAENLGKLVVLTCLHHINKRVYNTWTAQQAKPPHLAAKINPEINLSETFDRLRICLDKIRNLCIFLGQYEDKLCSDVDSDHGSVSTYTLSGRQSHLKSLTSDSTPTCYKIPNNALPEYELLEFLLNSQHMMSVQKYLSYYGNIPYLHTYLQSSFPVITDFVPAYIYEPVKNPVPDIAEQSESEVLMI